MRISGAHDFYPVIEPADAGSLPQSHDTAWEAFIGDPTDAAYDRLGFYARACPVEAATAAASQARFFTLVRTREWYQSVDPEDVAQGFREAVAFRGRHPGAGPALAHLSATVAMRPALRDAVLEEFPTSVAARVLRSAAVGPPPPPVALARLIAADFPAGLSAGLSRLQPAPHSPQDPRGECRALPRLRPSPAIPPISAPCRGPRGRCTVPAAWVRRGCSGEPRRRRAAPPRRFGWLRAEPSARRCR
jgi:hypothetical protein